MPAQFSIATPPDKPALVAQGPYKAKDFGTLWLVWSGQGLVWVGLSGRRPAFDDGIGPKVRSVPLRFKRPLDAYFRRRPVDPTSIPVDPRGTPFQLRVWEALRKIPRGQVRSYGGIALDVGSPRAMRAVGMANRMNPLPLVVPCHRVVRRGRWLGGYAGGVNMKRFLLRLEGVTVEADRVHPGQLDLL